MSDGTMRLLSPTIRSGYDVARRGEPAGANLYRPETLGGHAWAFGHATWSLPAPLRWVALALSWGSGGTDPS